MSPTFESDFILPEAPFRLSNGEALPEVRLRYALYGELNEARDNAILVCHALTGSARVADWWGDLFREQDGAFDLQRHCVIGVNVVGSCYGSTGPGSVNPETGERFGGKFPVVSFRDVVRAQRALIESLGIRQLAAVVGGSIGGMQAMQWAVDFPEVVRACVSIGAAPLSAMGLALNHLQRQAIMNDPAWRGGDYEPDAQPVAGLALARGIAMCSYKSAELFEERFARNPNRSGEVPGRSLGERFDVAGYLDHQGDVFIRRFDANSYLALSKAMDLFDLGLEYYSENEALTRVTAKTYLVGISSDWLFPASDVKALADRMRLAGAQVHYNEIETAHGHDGFLAEPDRVVSVIRAALATGRAACGD